ncbi:MAG: SPASM domain-containing protein [Candidatus Gorgyraea atricola]|nr:SPASM domain-containing protein [Candidatus Gorgyraea atricola]
MFKKFLRNLLFSGKNRLKSGEKERLMAITEDRITKLAVEVTNICNANCIFCGYRHQKRKKYILSNEQFRYFLDKYVEYGGGELKFTPIVGDPLVDKNLIDKIKMARRERCIGHMYLFTNLIGLNNFNITDFLLSGINRVYVSTCIGNKKMYKRVFGVDCYDVVISNIEKLLKENNKLGKPVKIVITSRGERPYRGIYGSSDYKRIVGLYGANIEILEEYGNWTGDVTENELPRGHSFRKIKNRIEPCSQLYNGFIILANGDAGICWCTDLEANLIIGNVYKESLDDIWRGEKLKSMRENWLKGDMPPICRNCHIYTPVSVFLSCNRKKINNTKESFQYAGK